MTYPPEIEQGLARDYTGVLSGLRAAAGLSVAGQYHQYTTQELTSLLSALPAGVFDSVQALRNTMRGAESCVIPRF